MIEIERTMRPAREISMIPLINVIFMLLVFFLIAGNMQRFDVLSVEPPIAENGEDSDQAALVLVVGRHQELLLEDDMVEVKDLVGLLQPKFTAHPQLPITIKADSKAQTAQILDLLEKIQQAGGENITLVTQKP